MLQQKGISIAAYLTINFIILPFEIEVLEKIVRDSLHKYISYSNQMLSFNQISFIASATVNDQMYFWYRASGLRRDLAKW